MYKHNPLPAQYRRESNKPSLAAQLVVLGILFIAIIYIGGKAFDSGFENRCEAWGNPEVCTNGK